MSASRDRRPRGAEAAATHAERPLAWPGDPQGLTATDIDIEALAHVLANTCRWGGRTRRFYAIAQRAVVASEEIEALDGLGAEERRRLALHALLADTRIAWLGDGQASGPAAARASSARAAERSRREGAAIDRAVREAAGLDGELTSEQADLLRFVARMTDAAERRDLADADTGSNAGAAFPPLRKRIRPVEPGRAARLWLARYAALTGPSGEGAAGEAGGQPNIIEQGENDDVANLRKARSTETTHGTERDDGERPLAA